MKRREFLKTAAAAAAVGGLPVAAAAKPVKAKIERYNLLGRTGLKMSDISFGGGRLGSSALVLRAIDRGINYFDTSPDYGGSESVIGDALRRGGKKKREKIIIASKFCSKESYPGHLPLGSSKKEYIRAVEGSLRRMGTDHLDIVFVHALGEGRSFEEQQRRFTDPEMLAAYEELKKVGKVRFLAASSHGPHNMERLMMEVVKSGRFDVIMPAFNFMKFPKVPEVLKEAKARGVGVVAMKTLAGARAIDLDQGMSDFEHAAFRWTLQHPEVAGLVVTIRSVKEMNHYLQASGGNFEATDRRSLDRYAALHGADYCRTGCGDCNETCPAGVDIASILRFQMYFEDYGEEKRAMQSYAALAKNAEACLDCADAACEGNCPYGLPVGEKLRAAHRSLTFTGS